MYRKNSEIFDKIGYEPTYIFKSLKGKIRCKIVFLLKIGKMNYIYEMYIQHCISPTNHELEIKFRLGCWIENKGVK
jgi:hypothetical protein